MGLGDLGELGDIGMIVGSVVGIGISAIVLLTFAPGIVGDIDGFSLAGTERCEFQGERFRWVLKGPSTATDGEDAWAAFRTGTTGYSVVKLKDSSGKCIDAAATPAGAGGVAFTPKGIRLTGTDLFKAAMDNSEWRKANASLTALSGGTIVLLLFSASAILVPAGAIGFLGYFGARFIASNIGGGVLSIAIGATVIVVLAGAILPEVFDPLDRLYLSLDGQRFWVYSVGIGKLGPIIGNFMGIALLGGIVTLGMLLWNGHKSSGSMANAM